MLAKILWAITMAISALVSGSGATDHAHEGISAVGSFYLHSDEHGVPTLWTESNGIPGLQVEVSVGPGGLLAPPDSRVMT